ncbi:MAG: DNA gyrase inhibitor YacG [Alphaproteobacteria bacterium]|nr:DNA gyrase inhibitor YacG [Alphaproteobacteria bacterium]
MSEQKDSAEVIPLTRVKCPVCQKRATVDFKPFCSKRCADVDLGKWLNGTYAIASQDEPDFDEQHSEETD